MSELRRKKSCVFKIEFDWSVTVFWKKELLRIIHSSRELEGMHDIAVQWLFIMGNYFENPKSWLQLLYVCASVIDIAPTHAKTRASNCFVVEGKIFLERPMQLLVLLLPLLLKEPKYALNVTWESCSTPPSQKFSKAVNEREWLHWSGGGGLCLFLAKLQHINLEKL